MVIIGANGHAKEVLEVVKTFEQLDQIYFFDNISSELPAKLFGQYEIIKSDELLKEHFINDATCVLGIGGSRNRAFLFSKIKALGGSPSSIISSTAILGTHDVFLSEGLNIMHYALISNSVKIGLGTLINAGVFVHHDVEIGEFCEISPRVTITGGVKIGNGVTIGASATILPKIIIGDNVIIGAGSLVTKNIAHNSLVMGVPAKVIKQFD